MFWYVKLLPGKSDSNLIAASVSISGREHQSLSPELRVSIPEQEVSEPYSTFFLQILFSCMPRL